MKPGSYGDSICLKAFCLEFNSRLTVLQSHTLTEVRFRHQETLDKVDFALVFNGKEHYSAASKCVRLLT